MKTFKVATFAHRDPNGRLIVSGYLRDFSPSWEGYQEIVTEAASGREAVRLAKKIRAECEQATEGRG